MHFPIFCGQYAQHGQELAGNLPKRGALRVCAGLRLGDDLTLDEHVLGQTRDLDAASGREGLGEIAGVDGVDGGEIVMFLMNTVVLTALDMSLPAACSTAVRLRKT